MTSYVVDAAAVVAVLSDAGVGGDWVATTLAGAHLLAPALMPFEVSNVLRRLELSGDLTPDAAQLEHAGLVDLDLKLKRTANRHCKVLVPPAR